MTELDIRKDLLNVHEAAAFLNVSVTALRGWTRQGWARPVKCGRQYFYRPEDLLACFSRLVFAPFIGFGSGYGGFEQDRD